MSAAIGAAPRVRRASAIERNDGGSSPSSCSAASPEEEMVPWQPMNQTGAAAVRGSVSMAVCCGVPEASNDMG